MKKIIDNRVTWLLFGLCWAVYFISYIGRINYPAAMPAMIESGWLTMAQAGSLTTAFLICYGGGQFINGFLGDRFKPENLIFAGLGLSAAANFLVPHAPGFGFAIVFWAVNGYVLSMIWPPIIRIFAEMFDEKTMVKCGIHITSSMALGALSAYLLASLLIRLLGWQAVFYVAAVLLLCMGIVWRGVFAYIKKHRENHGVTQPAADPQPGSFAKPGAAIGIGVIVFLTPIFIHGAVKDGMSSWVPVYMVQIFEVPAYTAALVVSVLPIFNLSGAYAAGFLLKRWGKSELACAAVFFAISLAGLMGVILFGTAHILLTAVFFAITTASIMAVNVLMINIVPLRFHSVGRSATVTGMFNATAYAGSAIAAIGIGWIAGGFGWGVVMVCFAVLVAAAGVMCAITGRRRLM